MGQWDREEKGPNKWFLIPVALSSRTLGSSVDHASVLSQPWGEDAQLPVDVYQPHLWLFVHQISYPFSHWTRAGSRWEQSLDSLSRTPYVPCNQVFHTLHYDNIIRDFAYCHRIHSEHLRGRRLGASNVCYYCFCFLIKFKTWIWDLSSLLVIISCRRGGKGRNTVYLRKRVWLKVPRHLQNRCVFLSAGDRHVSLSVD